MAFFSKLKDLAPSSFYLLHLSYFMLLTAFGTLALFLYHHFSVHSYPVSFIDALYTATSAISLTGHMCLPMELLPAFDKAILLLLLVLGNHVVTSFLPLYLRSSALSHSKTSLEYKALTTLSLILLLYFLGFQLAGYVAIELYVLSEPSIMHIIQNKHVSAPFFAIFSSISSFANSGLSLFNDSMTQFSHSISLMLITSILILLGNTMFPPCLRLIIWVLHKLSKGNSSKLDVYEYLLKHPRKCYIYLFPHTETMWLIITVAVFSSLQLVLLCMLDWGSKSFRGLDLLHKLAMASFQSVATRTAGEDVLNVADLSPAILIFYVGMMYLSVYPVYLSRENSDSNTEFASTSCTKNEDSKIFMQSRKLLARDSAFIFIAVFIVCLLESENISIDPLNYSIFNIFFEVVSAYGNVGFSIGYDCSLAKSNTKCEDIPYSFSGKWNKGAKFVLVVVMLFGRHRGLPQDIESTFDITLHGSKATILDDIGDAKLPLSQHIPCHGSISKLKAFWR